MNMRTAQTGGINNHPKVTHIYHPKLRTSGLGCRSTPQASSLWRRRERWYLHAEGLASPHALFW
jgi:hypothetical protein